ncbi:MAG TPA: hypothetical protein PLL25_11020, partial [Flavobacteriales bacterium]|nr:hypothetical protein [Flavobacteriales bacterium]
TAMIARVNERFFLEDNGIVLEDNGIVLEDNVIVLEDNVIVLEDKAVVLEDNGVILVHDRSVPVYALGLPLTCAVVQRGRHTESATVCPVMPKGAIRWLFHRKPKLDKGSTLRSTGYPVGAVLPVSR